MYFYFITIPPLFINQFLSSKANANLFAGLNRMRLSSSKPDVSSLVDGKSAGLRNAGSGFSLNSLSKLINVNSFLSIPLLPFQGIGPISTIAFELPQNRVHPLQGDQCLIWVPQFAIIKKHENKHHPPQKSCTIYLGTKLNKYYLNLIIYFRTNLINLNLEANNNPPNPQFPRLLILPAMEVMADVLHPPPHYHWMCPVFPQKIIKNRRRPAPAVEFPRPQMDRWLLLQIFSSLPHLVHFWASI